MSETHDIKSLAISPIWVNDADTPDILECILPDTTSSFPQPELKRESYIRLNSLPGEISKMALIYIEAKIFSEKVSSLTSALPKVEPNYYPSGIAELRWNLDDGSIFSLLFYSVRRDLFKEDGVFKIEKHIKMGWRLDNTKGFPQSGEFKTLEEAYEFMEKSFVA